MKRLAQQQATWTRGPSLPSHMPDPTARHYIQPMLDESEDDTQHAQGKGGRTKPKDFVTNVHVPKKRLMTKPPRTVLISGIPLCFA